MLPPPSSNILAPRRNDARRPSPLQLVDSSSKGVGQASWPVHHGPPAVSHKLQLLAVRNKSPPCCLSAMTAPLLPPGPRRTPPYSRTALLSSSVLPLYSKSVENRRKNKICSHCRHAAFLCALRCLRYPAHRAKSSPLSIPLFRVPPRLLRPSASPRRSHCLTLPCCCPSPHPYGCASPRCVLCLCGEPGHIESLFIFAILSIAYRTSTPSRGFSHDNFESGRGSAEPLALPQQVFIPAGMRCVSGGTDLP